MEVIGTLVQKNYSSGGKYFGSSKYKAEYKNVYFYGRLTNDEYLVEGDKFIVVIMDTLRPDDYMIPVLSNPVFHEYDSLKVSVATVDKITKTYCRYSYIADNISITKLLYKRNADAGIKKGDKFVALVNASNIKSAIILLDEPLSEPEEKEIYKKFRSLITYNQWLRRGIIENSIENYTDVLDIRSAGAFLYEPDSVEISQMVKYYSQGAESLINQRKNYLNKNISLLNDLAINVKKINHRFIRFHLYSGETVLFDVRKYKNAWNVVLFNGKDHPIVRDSYIDETSFFFKQYFQR